MLLDSGLVVVCSVKPCDKLKLLDRQTDINSQRAMRLAKKNTTTTNTNTITTIKTTTLGKKEHTVDMRVE